MLHDIQNCPTEWGGNLHIKWNYHGGEHVGEEDAHEGFAAPQTAQQRDLHHPIQPHAIWHRISQNLAPAQTTLDLQWINPER